MDLLDAFLPLVRLGVGPIFIVAGVFTRISALVFFLPGLGEASVPARVRLGAAFAIALVLTPIVMETSPAAPQSVSAFASMIVAEAVCGALIGFSIRIAIYAVQTAGSIAAQSLSLAQLFTGGIDSDMEPPVATLLMIAAVALAAATGVHFKAVSALAYSYQILPFGDFPGASDAGHWAADRAAYAFSAAMSLALPFVLLGFVYNLAIGAANRAMPQLMVAFVGAPAVTLAGLILLALTAPLLLGAWMRMLDGAFSTLMGLS